MSTTMGWGDGNARNAPLADEQAPSRPRITDELLGELRQWIDAGRLPELIPTHQQRSLRTALAMLDAGRALLMERSLEELSVEMVCRSAGTTVGAFYGRFENKQAFFMTLQRVQILRAEELLDDFVKRHADGRASLDTLCEDMVHMTVQRFRANVGVLRAALQHARQGMWRPFKVFGDRCRDALVIHMAPRLGWLPPAQRKLRIQFAYQMLAGTLVHAALNDPGPLALDDTALASELTRMVRAYLNARD